MLFHQDVHVVTDTCLGSGASTYIDRTESIYTEGFNPTQHNYRSHRHYPATHRPADRGQEPGVVHRHTRVIIDRSETFLNVPPNHRPPVKPFRGYPMHPDDNGPDFSPFPTLQPSAPQPATSSSEAAKIHAFSLQNARRRSAPSIIPAREPGIAGSHVVEIPHEENGFGEQVNETLSQWPRTCPPPSGTQVICSGRTLPQECTTPITVQLSRNGLVRPAIEALPNSNLPRPMAVLVPTPQVPASENQFQHHRAPVAAPATVPRHQYSGQTPAGGTGSTATKRPHSALATGKQAPWVNMNLGQISEIRRNQRDHCKLRRKAARQAARAKGGLTAANRMTAATGMTAANEMAAENEMTAENEMGTSGEIISAQQMTTENEMAAANTIAGADETLTRNETPAVANMPTANPPVNEVVHQVPDNIKREYPENTGMFRFVAGMVDASEWLE
ncbi:MAG: hypothetical protein LQ339_001794 [Xanthoria mediterranea]|nr:MAG: hypothetical protein LQ339_001794 [Xanthoria mediterranea]